MPAHFIDFEIQEDVFSTSELRNLFDEKARFQRWLDIEAALAHTQGKMGIIPQDAADEICNQSRMKCLNIEEIKNEYKINRNSLMPILKGLRKACRNGYGEYVHYGATTQDIIDTGQILEIKEMLSIVYRDLREIESILVDLAKKHLHTPMIGRTHSQHAIPITFSLKVSVWIKEIRRHIQRVKSLSSRVLIGQLSGAVGTMAAFGENAEQVIKDTLNHIGLQSSNVSWHTARDNIAEVSTCFCMAVSTVAKIANEIFQLGKTETLELREPLAKTKTTGSSTMPHKRNPVLCERIIVLSKHVRALSNVVMETMMHENERDPRSLWSEWLSIPQLSIYTGAALKYAIDILKGLEVYPEKMKANLYKYGDFAASEQVLFKLGECMGKMRAQERLHHAIQQAERQGISFKKALANDPEIIKHLNEDDLDIIEHPEQYIGNAVNIVTSVLKEHKKLRDIEQKTLFPI